MNRGSRQRGTDARRLFVLNSTMSGWSLFNTYQNNRLKSFCPFGYYITWNPQGLCDNPLIAWLAWRKALLAEFLYRYVVWQRNVLRERWGWWIRVIQTDRVSWNMKPGRFNLSEKKKKKLTVHVWGWVNLGGGGGVQRRSQTEMRHKTWWRKCQTQNVNPEKERNREVFSQRRNLERHSTYSYHTADVNHTVYT